MPSVTLLFIKSIYKIMKKDGFLNILRNYVLKYLFMVLDILSYLVIMKLNS